MESFIYGKAVLLVIVLFWGIMLVLVAWATPEKLILHDFSLKSSTNIWNVEIKEVTNYNQLLFIDIKICPKDQIIYNLIIQATNQKSGTYGKNIYNKIKKTTLKCKKTRLYTERINYSNYLITFAYLSIQSPDLTIGYSNPDHLSYSILIKGLLFITSILSTYLCLRLSSPHTSKKILTISLSTILVTFPYNLCSILHNSSIWPISEHASILLYTLSFFLISPTSAPILQISSQRRVYYLLPIIFYSSLSIFTYSILFLSPSTTSLILSSLPILILQLTTLLPILSRLLLLPLSQKLNLALDLFLKTQLLLSLSSKIFISASYPELETLSFTIFASFLLYCHWFKFLIKSASPLAAPIRPSESEMISFSNA